MGKYKYKYNEDIIIESDINIRDVKTFEEAKQLAEDFLVVLWDYGDEKVMYYDCSDTDLEEPDMKNDSFAIVDSCGRVPLKKLEEKFSYKEEETSFIKEYLDSVKSVFKKFQEEYNNMLQSVEDIRKECDDRFIQQFVTFDYDRYNIIKTIYNEKYLEEIGKIASYWNGKIQEYGELRDDDQPMSDIICTAQEEETTFNIRDL